MVFLLQLTFKCSRDRGRCGRERARLVRARWGSVRSRASGMDTGGAGSTKEDFERRVAKLVRSAHRLTHPVKEAMRNLRGDLKSGAGVRDRRCQPRSPAVFL